MLLAIAASPVCNLFAWGNDTLVPVGQNYLEMRGRILKSEGQQRDESKNPLDSAVVSVVNEGGKTIWSGFTDAKGRLNIRLPLGKKFTMYFNKKGFVKKFISVDTHVTGDPKKNFDFTYDIDIFEKVDGLDVTVLDSPVAKIAYKPYDKTFTYDAAYTNKVNAGLQKMYHEYYALKKKEAQLAVSDSTATIPSGTKPAGAKKSIPYGQGKKQR
ncbi:MAG: carboxypeptidase-like regulatory domain-containing protein [Bacteroidota bacterium]|nr:carboxypeptidase-like regulatory domain-containing protein [Bacteroidota bacterium]